MAIPVVSVIKSLPPKGECLVVFAGKDRRGEVLLHTGRKEILTAAKALIETGEFQAKENSLVSLYQVAGYKRVILAGLPSNKKPFDGESVRRLGAQIIPAVEKYGQIAVDLLEMGEIVKSAECEEDVFTRSLAEGMILKAYRFEKFKSLKPEEREKRKLARIQFVSESNRLAVRLQEVQITCEGTCTARDLINEPSNILNAPELARRAQALGKAHGFKVTVFDKKKITELGMGGLLAVNRGSANPPRFIILEHRPKGAKKTVVLVGKGLTFDTGGISLKPAAGMGDMKCDMSGAAAVIGTVTNAARLGIKVNVIGLIASTDNKTGSNAQNPGDVITLMNGTTVEVDNTDAEGRLVLGDALHYGRTRYEADLTIDLATLTGACVVALGRQATGLFTNHEPAVAPLVKAGEKTFERVWPMPMFDEYADQIKSHIADVKNVGGREAGSVTAAKFLEKFVDGKPWVHLDIAGTAFLDSPAHYLPKEGVGVGVRLLTAYLRDL